MNGTSLLTDSVFVALAAALVSAFFSRRASVVFGFVAFVGGFAAGIVTPLGGAGLAALGCSLYFAERHAGKSALKLSAFMAAGVLAWLATVHLLPGFHNLKVLQDAKMSDLSAPFTMYLNFDKPFAALLVLLLTKEAVGLRFGSPKVAPALIWTGVAIVCGLACGMGSGLIRFDLKWPDSAWLWTFNNLLLVCVAEEVIFRRYILGRLIGLAMGSPKIRYVLALVVSSLAFGAAHYREGVAFACLASLLGGVYATSYLRARSLAAAIVTHFAVNAVHFVFFTYPYLAKGV